jgi:hypothetical protein
LKKLSWPEFVIWPCQTICMVWLISSMKNIEQRYGIRVWIISVWTLHFPTLQAVFIRISSKTNGKPTELSRYANKCLITKQRFGSQQETGDSEQISSQQI